MPDQLPIHEIEQPLVDLLGAGNRLVVQAPTGSGKSTRIPQMLLDHGLAGNGQVVVLQPRRLPTRMLAARVAQERNVPLGTEVGYQIRFEDRTSAATRIKFETEGVLLRQMLSNPSLEGVSAIIFDEFHERHLYGDVTLARARALQVSSRPDLKIVVMSATLDVDRVIEYLEPCELLVAEGRVYPVTIDYLSRTTDPKRTPVWELAAREYERAVADGHDGDALVFMPGAYEIRRTVEAIRHSPAGRGCIILPLHGELPPADQDAAVARYKQRKIIVATNVAETSLTIDGVRVVIDSGLARISNYDPYRGINTLRVEKISRASADQRAGRAGRTAPGYCLRLWTTKEHEGRAAQLLPEVQRVDLAETVLSLKAAGVEDIRAFPWLEKPDERSLDRSETLLEDLGAVHGDGGAITQIGHRMVAFPLHPRYSRMLLAAGELNCVKQVALIAALTQGRDLLVHTRDKAVLAEREDLVGEEDTSDFFVLMRAWLFADRNRYDLRTCRNLGIHAHTARQVRPLWARFLKTAERQGLPINETPPDDEALQRCLLVGFSDHLAQRLDAGSLRCALVHGRRGELARDSVVRDRTLFVAAEVHEIEGRHKELHVRLSLATAVEEAWLKDLFPDDFSTVNEVVFDPSGRKVVARTERRFRDLVLESKKTEQVPADEAAAVLAKAVVRGDCVLKKWDRAVEQWIARVNFVSANCPEIEMAPIDESDRHSIIELICAGATRYKEIKDREIWPVLKAWLVPEHLHALDALAPERYTLPGGRRVKLQYGEDGGVRLAARISDLYGLETGVQVAHGRVPVTIEIQGPHHRPVQVTQDLSTFWSETYPKVKAEMQRKYPKHEWR